MTERQKPRILVVDDEPDLRRTLQLRLTSQGFDVQLAVDGMDAYNKVQEERPDCIILDLMMPVMDGFSFLKRVRSLNDTADIPVIILTAATEPRNRTKSDIYEADAYIRKPYRPERLERAISRLCSVDADVETTRI